MANEKQLVLTAQDAIAKAEQELSTSHYIAECTRSPGMRAIHEKRCTWLSVIVTLAKKAAAVEVVHGRWVFGTANHREYMKCSECLKSQMPTGVFTYCPNCGAKMDGGNEDG